jgi:hypothetical protein
MRRWTISLRPGLSLSRCLAILPILCILMSCGEAPQNESEETTIPDEYVRRTDALNPDRTPPEPDPATYGMDAATGRFIYPAATPEQHDDKPFAGQLDYWDTNEYAHNMKVEAYYPILVEPFHTWQNIVDFDGRRYMYQYVRGDVKIYDITNPKDLKVLLEKGHVWTSEGSNEIINPYPDGEMFGAASIQWNKDLEKYIMVQAYEVRRFGLLHDKRTEPERVEQIRHANHLKGFKVYEMNGPLPDDWKLLAEVTTDYEHPDAPVGQQEGSGVRDIPGYFGGQYMFVAAAPSASHSLTEYPNDLYSAGYQAWDMSDPANPKFLDQFNVVGQILGDSAHEEAFKKNPRAGNRTSWFGSRMSIFIPKPVEEGGKYGYAAMAGLGFYVLDVSNPTEIKEVSHLEFEPSVAGTEGDYINVSQVEKTGIVYYSGYPLNSDGWEPYKDIFMIDINDPANPKVIGTLPRPVPPADASFTDYAQRRGSFGPKRSGYYTQPGTPKDNILPYAFYNAGVQIFDVSDLSDPKITAYFVPKFDPNAVPSYALGNLSHGVYMEYDRNLIWLFTNHGFYCLSTPALGRPDFGPPKTPWPKR